MRVLAGWSSFINEEVWLRYSSLVLGVVLAISGREATAQAYKLCVNTKVWSAHVVADIYVPKIWGHHAYLSIEKDSELIVGFGYWETVGFNNPPNLPVTDEQRLAKLPNETVDEEKYCRSIDENQLEEILEQAEAYPDTHGSYHKYFNNCVEFVDYFFEKYTDDSLPKHFNSPYLLHLWIKKQ